MIQDRVPRVKHLLEQCELDAFVFFHPVNLRYLCGFTGTDGALLVGGGRDCFLTDSRYTIQARRQVAADQIEEYKSKVDGVIERLRAAGARRIGFEAETLPYAQAQKLQQQGDDLTWVPIGDEMLSLRGKKGAAEIDALCEAARISAEAFEEILPLVRPGAVEKEIALALEFAMKRRGGEEKAFDFIVASGSRGALPHGVASEKEIAAGELVTFDFGTRFAGYHSDETVTVAVGEIAPRLREIYDTVLRAHDLAIEQVRPGVLLKEIDAVARRHIADCGFGEYFGHGLGHGVGLEVHEYPTVSPRSAAVAEEGMVITIEPGIYVPHLGGVRIEDMVQVTADGSRILTRISKEFRTLPE